MDRPPTRLHISIETPAGTTYRWGLDEPNPANVPSGLTFSTTMPGGFEQMSCVLPRRAELDYQDLQEFSTVTVYGTGGETAWQGRLETTPRTSGDQLSITPGAVGWQAALDDDAAARMIYIDSDLTRWSGMSVGRQLGLINGGAQLGDGPSVAADVAGGQPSLQISVTGPWGGLIESDAWYDAHGLPIAALFYAWKKGGVINPVDTNWNWQAQISNDDIGTSTDTTGTLRAAGPGSGSFNATPTKAFAFVSLYYSTAQTSVNATYPVYWTALAIIGSHSLAIQGTWTATGGIGVLASDVIRHAVQTWAPTLATNRAGQSTIETTTFIIPHLAFTDPTTASQIIAAALQYELLDWWIDEGPTFNLASRANHGTVWRARVGPSGLQETGPQVDRMYNAVIVSYNDTAGVARTVGPPGETVDTTDSTLLDTDPTNPVNVAGLYRPYEMPNIGVSTPAGAIAIGQRFLAETKQASTAGQAQIIGHVQDSRGIWWPAWLIRAGDWIVFTDAHDPSPRRITKTSYSDSSRANQLDLDSPPQGLPALLARYGIALTGLV